MIHINSTATLAKAFSVKREKGDDENECVIAHLKIAEVLLDRYQLDELCGQPIGWSAGALFDEFGAPRARVTLALNGRAMTLSGVLRGGEKSIDPKLSLKDADVDSITLELTKMGALLACQLSWIAAGDEVDDIADMLGQVCACDVVVHDGGQQDMLKPAEVQLAERLAEPPPRTNRISSADEVMHLLQKKGFHLRGSEPDYWVEKPDGSQRQGVWLNAAKSVLKRGLEPIGDGDTDEVGRWKWRERSAA